MQNVTNQSKIKIIVDNSYIKNAHDFLHVEYRSQVLRLLANLGLTQESLSMVTARVLVVLSGSFTPQIDTGPTLT